MLSKSKHPVKILTGCFFYYLNATLFLKKYPNNKINKLIKSKIHYASASELLKQFQKNIIS